MSSSFVPVPAARKLLISDHGRHLLPGAIRMMATDAVLRDGDLAIAEVLEIGRHPQLALASGREAELAEGDRIVVVVGRVNAPLAFSGVCPTSLGECALLSASGAAGLVTAASRGLPPTRLRLLGLAVDEAGTVLNLRRLVPTAACGTDSGMARSQRIAVVSCARGSHASKVTAALVRGYARSGAEVAVAKPTGVADAAERWRFLDAGAAAAVDLVDAGRLCSAELDRANLVAVTEQLCATLAGNSAVIVRVAGGLARRDTRALVCAPQFVASTDGVVLAAADALSAIEGARLLAAAGLRLLAVSGAICRSPLAMAEARNELSCPVLDAQALGIPARLQALLAGNRPAAADLQGVDTLSIAA